MNIKNNALEGFPNEIAALTKLQNLHFEAVWMNDFPYLLLKLAAIEELPGGHQVSERATYISRLAREINQRQFSWELAIFLMDVLADRRQKIKLLPKYKELLMQAMNSRLPIIRETIQEIITQEYQQTPNKQLSSSAVIAAIGKTSFNLNQLRQRMKDLSIQYTSKITEEVTHIILGKSPHRKIEQALEHKEGYIFITEKILLNYLNKVDTPYLLEEKASNVEQLAALLLSQQQENIEIALEILGKGGATELITELTIVYFSDISQQTKRKTRCLLEQYGSRGLARHFSTSNSLLRGVIQGYYTDYKEERVLKLFKKLQLDQEKIFNYLENID